jgi:hypothetical protein
MDPEDQIIEDQPNGEDPEIEEADGDAPEGEGADAEDGSEDAAEDEGQDGPDAVAEAPRRRPSRYETRIQALTRAREEDRREFERRLSEVQQQVNAPRQRQETPEEREARIALMTPEERTDFRIREIERRHQEDLQRLAFQTAEATDQAAFNATIRANPNLQRYAASVESELAKLRQRGLNLPREQVLDWVIGQQARARMGQGSRQQNSAKNRVAKQTVRPVNGGGDVAAQRGKRGQSLRERLEGVEI